MRRPNITNSGSGTTSEHQPFDENRSPNGNQNFKSWKSSRTRWNPGIDHTTTLEGVEGGQEEVADGASLKSHTESKQSLSNSSTQKASQFYGFSIWSLKPAALARSIQFSEDDARILAEQYVIFIIIIDYVLIRLS
ncbi:unnamed protein product [Trichobilharzia regenti]|nr:unnamed protein product [Trichobilharzia regenti]